MARVPTGIHGLACRGRATCLTAVRPLSLQAALSSSLCPYACVLRRRRHQRLRLPQAALLQALPQKGKLPLTA